MTNNRRIVKQAEEGITSSERNRSLVRRYFGERIAFHLVSTGLLFLAFLAPAQAQGPKVSGSAVWPITPTSANIIWDTDQTATSTVNWGLTSAYGQTVTSTSNIYHAVLITGLTPLTTYHYQVITTDSAGTTTLPDATFTTGQPLPTISSLAASSITSTSATITWTTDQSSSSQVFYGTTSAYGSQSSLDNTQVTTHSVTLSGLAPGTTYNYEVASTDTSGTTTSRNSTFQTASSDSGQNSSSGSGPWSSCGSGGSAFCILNQVGIGTTSPQAQLTIETPNITNDGVRVYDATATKWLHLAPNLDGGGYNPISQLYDRGLIYGGSSLGSPGGGLVLAPWSSATSGIRIDSNGNVGIGISTPTHMLHVAGTIGATEVIVSSTGADYVFEPGYHLMPLTEVAAYIKQNHHLPNIPSVREVQAKGADLGDMQAKLLAKVEELTLHMIRLEKEDEELRQKMQTSAKAPAKPELRRRVVAPQAAVSNGGNAK